MKKLILAVSLVFQSFMVFSQPLTEASTISLLTGSPGTELYSTFGHSAIRVRDPHTNLDAVFNYGTFNFNTDNFYLKFVRGKLEYMLSVESYEQFLYGFKYENRSVEEQVLNLTLEQKQMLYDFLMENYKPENRFYKYDFFFDNCATRIRDIMVTAFGDDFQYNYPAEWESEQLTFRNLIDLYLGDHHWSDFGIDIALGLPTDDIARPKDYMFLPDYLAEGFEGATLQMKGKKVPFASSRKLILGRKDIAPEVFFITPARLMWFVFIISAVMTFWSFKKKVSIILFDHIFFSVIGILGWIVFLLWFFTDHIATKDNLNILWAFPIHFPIFIFWTKLSVQFRRWYIWICGSIDVFILVLWPIFPQQYHFAFIPLILVILMRFFIMLRSDRLEAIHT